MYNQAAILAACGYAVPVNLCSQFAIFATCAYEPTCKFLKYVLDWYVVNQTSSWTISHCNNFAATAARPLHANTRTKPKHIQQEQHTTLPANQSRSRRSRSNKTRTSDSPE